MKLVIFQTFAGILGPAEHVHMLDELRTRVLTISSLINEISAISTQSSPFRLVRGKLDDQISIGSTNRMFRIEEQENRATKGS